MHGNVFTGSLGNIWKNAEPGVQTAGLSCLLSITYWADWTSGSNFAFLTSVHALHPASGKLVSRQAQMQDLFPAGNWEGQLGR